MYFDILQRPIICVCPHCLESLDRLHAAGYSAKDCVFAIEEWRGCLYISFVIVTFRADRVGCLDHLGCHVYSD